MDKFSFFRFSVINSPKALWHTPRNILLIFATYSKQFHIRDSVGALHQFYASPLDNNIYLSNVRMVWLLLRRFSEFTNAFWFLQIFLTVFELFWFVLINSDFSAFTPMRSGLYCGTLVMYVFNFSHHDLSTNYFNMYSPSIFRKYSLGSKWFPALLLCACELNALKFSLSKSCGVSNLISNIFRQARVTLKTCIYSVELKRSNEMKSKF